MRDMREFDPDDSFNVKSFLQVLRAVAVVLGVAAILVGVVFAVRVFAVAFNALRDPAGFQPLLAQWAETVGGEKLDVVIEGNKYPCAGVLATIVLGGGGMMLVWIAMGLVMAGAKVVSWTLGDRTAVKKMLEQAFGPSRKPELFNPDRKDGS